MKFIKGLTLNEKYYHEVVAPLVQQFDPQLTYTSSLLGYGSDVLGFDTATSMDHNWGPRLQIFLDESDLHRKKELDAFLSANLPVTFMGLPTNFAANPGDPIRRMAPATGPPVNHLIEIYSIDAFVLSILGKPLDELTLLDWVRIPEQVLLEATAGKVFHDGLRILTPLRERLSYYPLDVQKLKIAALWQGIANEEAFLGRCIEHADYAGVKLISARIINQLMKICFGIQKRYIPYSKWFTAMFKTLGLSAIDQLITEVLRENDPMLIEEKVASLYREVITLNNTSDELPQITNTVRDYYNRPYKVVMAGEIATCFVGDIANSTIKKLDLLSVFIDNKIDAADFTDARPLIHRMVGPQP
ncbi:MAG: DUF4037 domain-containing protein [Bacteroidota bacterium]